MAGELKARITADVPQRLKNQVDHFVENTGIPISTLVRTLLAKLINEVEKVHDQTIVITKDHTKARQTFEWHQHEDEVPKIKACPAFDVVLSSYTLEEV